jgi:hypothetical protein
LAAQDVGAQLLGERLGVGEAVEIGLGGGHGRKGVVCEKGKGKEGEATIVRSRIPERLDGGDWVG